MIKYLKQNGVFSTPDMCLCASLLCYGKKIESMNREKDKAFFIFKKDWEFDGLIQKYWLHELLIEPILFFEKTKELKRRINLY